MRLPLTGRAAQLPLPASFDVGRRFSVLRIADVSVNLLNKNITDFMLKENPDTIVGVFACWLMQCIQPTEDYYQL